MAVELGKSGYEGEKDIAVQKEIYAAFLELMMELLKAIPGFNPRIDIEKGQGLTIERKPKGQAIDGVVEVEQKPLPEIIQNEPAKKPGIETLYGGGQNNLTPNDIKAISAIIAGKKGDIVIGGEGLIIKYNGKELFETDERGKISLHTAVSPQIKEKFAALQVGQTTPMPLPATTPNNTVRQTPKIQATVAQSQIQDQVGSLFANLVNSLPAIGVPKIPEEKQVSTINTAVVSQPPNNIVPPPNFSTEVRRVVEEVAINQQPVTNLEPVVSHNDISATELPSDSVVKEQIIEGAGESPPNVVQVEPVAISKKSLLENVGDYVVDRARRDTQVAASAVSQMASKLGTNLATNLAQGLQAIPDQYKVLKSRLTENVAPENDPKLETSINEFMDQIDGMFDEIQQDDPKLGLSDSYAQDETPKQVDQSLDSVVNNVVNATPESKPARLKTVSIEDALHYMSKRDDGAKAQDGKGYNLNDTSIGKNVTAQIDRGEALDNVQASETLLMLKKYHKQFAEGGIKLPTWKSVESKYSDPAYSAIDPRAIFARQQEKLDKTQTDVQQQAVLKAAFKIYTLNMPELDYPVRAGRYETELPTGAKFVNELDDLGINHLSLERDGKSILLGGIAAPGNYTPASMIADAMPELRQLRPFLTEDFKISSEPVKAISLTQPLPINKKDAAESIDPATDDVETSLTTKNEEKPYTIKTTKEPYVIKTTKEPVVAETVKAPARSRGGR
jgi:hypothetical protein